MKEIIFSRGLTKSQLESFLKPNSLFIHLVKNQPKLPWRKRVINRIKWKIKSTRVWLGEKIAGESFYGY